MPRRDGEVGELADDPVEHRLRVADEIHLVHRDEEPRDAEQRGDERVALGLGQDAVRRRR